MTKMLSFVLIVAASTGIAQTPRPKPTSLSQFIQAQQLPGPWIAVDPDHVFGHDEAPKDFSNFERKVVKLGGLSVVALNWTMTLDEDHLPNAYQAAYADDKLMFLLATLSQPALDKLFGSGLSAAELSGEQRAALISMFPSPFKYYEAQVHENGFQSQNEAALLPDDQIAQVKIQMRKGVNVGFGATSSGGGGNEYSSLSSLDYRGPEGTKIAVSADAFSFGDFNQAPGQVVDSFEKKSELAWSDPRLAEEIDVPNSGSLRDLVGLVREKTGVEIYADVRIAPYAIQGSGGPILAKDLLRGLALAIDGAIRRVGPAYVLTANVEGTATQEARLRLRKSIETMHFQSKLAQWYAECVNRGLPNGIGLTSDDLFQGSSVPASDFSSPTSTSPSDWVPLSGLPSPMQSAINRQQELAQAARKRQQEMAAQNHQNVPVENPVPSLQGQVKLSTNIGYRFVLPDGEPLQFHEYAPSLPPQVISNFVGPKQPGYPLDAKSLSPGTAVAFRSEDPQAVSSWCSQLKALNVSEIWLDSQSPAAIGAALKSGLTVDWMVHPWTVLHGESLDEVDRDLLGLTGSKVNEIPEARVDPIARRFTPHSNTFSPGDSDLGGHWDRLASLVPPKGLHRIILVETEPEGYWKPDELIGMRADIVQSQNGVVLFPGLQRMAPALFDFGYTDRLRLDFLRKFQIDPLDLRDLTVGEILAPRAPYFDNHFEDGQSSLRYVTFPNIHEIDFGNVISQWKQMRHELVAPKIAQLVEKLSPLADEIFGSGAGPAGYLVVTSYTQQGKGALVHVEAINPLDAENADGTIEYHEYRPDGPICFDLRDVPVERVPVYLRYLFKK